MSPLDTYLHLRKVMDRMSRRPKNRYLGNVVEGRKSVRGIIKAQIITDPAVGGLLLYVKGSKYNEVDVNSKKIYQKLYGCKYYI